MNAAMQEYHRQAQNFFRGLADHEKGMFGVFEQFGLSTWFDYPEQWAAYEKCYGLYRTRAQAEKQRDKVANQIRKSLIILQV